MLDYDPIRGQNFRPLGIKIPIKILMMTTQRFAASHTSDHTTSTIDIPSDDMKGRIIGREGRNIRALSLSVAIVAFRSAKGDYF